MNALAPALVLLIGTAGSACAGCARYALDGTCLEEAPSAPDPRFTRGDIISADRKMACAWGHTPRLYETDKAAYEQQARYVFELYEIPWSERKLYQLDDLVPRCIGGNDRSPRNLWPQSYPVAKIKDQKERAICRAVCHDQTMTIEDGQRYFMEGDWQR